MISSVRIKTCGFLKPAYSFRNLLSGASFNLSNMILLSTLPAVTSRANLISKGIYRKSH